jgi:hypothetical protein
MANLRELMMAGNPERGRANALTGMIDRSGYAAPLMAYHAGQAQTTADKWDAGEGYGSIQQALSDENRNDLMKQVIDLSKEQPEAATAMLNVLSKRYPEMADFKGVQFVAPSKDRYVFANIGDLGSYSIDMPRFSKFQEDRAKAGQPIDIKDPQVLNELISNGTFLPLGKTGAKEGKIKDKVIAVDGSVVELNEDDTGKVGGRVVMTVPKRSGGGSGSDKPDLAKVGILTQLRKSVAGKWAPFAIQSASDTAKNETDATKKQDYTKRTATDYYFDSTGSFDYERVRTGLSVEQQNMMDWQMQRAEQYANGGMSPELASSQSIRDMQEMRKSRPGFFRMKQIADEEPAGAAVETQPAATQQTAGDVLPPQAVKQLKAGANTRFGNGQVWTLRSGKPFRVK